MDSTTLRKLCKEHGMYTTPSLNDKLYLHYKGWSKIESLEAYTGVKALWLEGNGLSKIEGLEKQVLVRSLYLHENIIEKIEGLEAQTELDSLNLSKNFIKTIENLSHLKQLTSLNLANNTISTLASVEHVLEIPSLQTLDLQYNKIEEEGIVDILSRMPDLRVLYLMGNPCVKHIKHYRRIIVARCKNLRYLDDRPVFDEERRRCDAWVVAYDKYGIDAAMEAERNELNFIRKEKEEADERNFRAFEQLMIEGREIRRLREAAEAEAGGVAPAAGTTINPYSGETIIHVPEAEELRVAREARWNSAKLDAQAASLPPPPSQSPTSTDALPSEEVKHEVPLPPPPSPQPLTQSQDTCPPPPAPKAGTAWTKVAIQEDEDDEDTIAYPSEATDFDGLD